jgi:hypothetical protein
MQRKKTLISLGLLFLLIGITYAWRANRANAQYAKVKAMGDQMFANREVSQSPEERRQQWETMRRELDKLTPEQRKDLRKEGNKRFTDRIKQYLAMAPADKIKFLDEQIQRQEQMRQQWEARRAEMAAQGGQGGGGGPGGPNAAGNPGPNGEGRRRPATQEERERRRKERLNDTSPEDRAARDIFFHDMSARRAALGLPPLGPFGPGGGGPGSGGRRGP